MTVFISIIYQIEINVWYQYYNTAFDLFVMELCLQYLLYYHQKFYTGIIHFKEAFKLIFIKIHQSRGKREIYQLLNWMVYSRALMLIIAYYMQWFTPIRWFSLACNYKIKWSQCSALDYWVISYDLTPGIVKIISKQRKACYYMPKKIPVVVLTNLYKFRIWFIDQVISRVCFKHNISWESLLYYVPKIFGQYLANELAF